MLKPLIRVIPSYSGNVKLLCTTSDYIKSETKEFENDNTDTYDCYIRGAILCPLSRNFKYKPIEANLLSSDFSYDLKEYYKYYSDVFYSNGMTIDKTNVQQIDKLNPIYDRNLDLEYGVSRALYQKTSHQFEFFAPIYVDSSEDLPDSFYIEMKFKKKSKEVIKKMRVNIMNDFTNKRNYLCHYLSNYGKILDANVMNISVSNKNATVKGIDLLNGSMTTAIDGEVGNLLSSMNTINLFDLSIASAFKRCKISMKQVIPFAFTIDLEKVLDPSQLYFFKGCQVEISGHYSLKRSKMSLYDWSSNYTFFQEKIKKMDKNTGVLTLMNGNLDNIMDCPYPGISENRTSQYVFSNKISKMYSRWKLQATDDDMPYVINIAYPFSYNQNSSVKYGMFPSKPKTVTGIATAISSGTLALANDYSLMFPLGTTKELYEDKYASYASEYEEQVNKYGYSWFEIFNGTNKDDLIDMIKWGTVDTNNECYYNGVMHSMSSIYKKLQSSKEKIDKFAVVVNPVVNYVDRSSSENMKRANYTISTMTNRQFDTNCESNLNLVSIMVNGRPEAKSSCEAFLSISPNGYSLNSEVKENEVYEKVDKSTFSVNDSLARYVNPQDVGFTIGDVDDWYDYDDALDALHIAVSYDLSIYNLKKYFSTVEDDVISYSSSIFANTDIVRLGINWNVSEVQSTYCSYSYELLPLHTMSLILDSYEGKDCKMEWSYLKFSGNMSYIAYNYGIKIHSYDNISNANKDILSDDFIYGLDGNKFVYSPGYVKDTYDLMNSKNVLEDLLETYCGIKYQDIYDTNGLRYYYYVDKYLDFKPYVNPIINELCISSKYDKKPRKTTGFTAYMSSPYIDSSYSYIVFSPQHLISKPYGFNLYRKGKFFNHKWIKMLDTNEYRYEVLSYLVNKKIDISNIEDKNSTAYKVLDTTSKISRYLKGKIEERLNNNTRYMFMPVVFGDGEISANNVFIKKDDESSFFGNKIRKDDIDKDDDFIWCDLYNFKAVMRKAGFLDDAIEDLVVESKKRKARFLNKEHLYWWYNELCRNYKYEYPKNIETNWADKIYAKFRRLDVDEKNRIQVIDTYVRLSKLPEMNDENHEELKRFNFFYDSVEMGTDNIWKFKIEDKNWKYDNHYDLVFDLEAVRLNKDIYDKVIKIHGLEDEYQDIYLYRIEKNDEWERNMSSSSLSKLRYDDSSYDDWDKTSHLLIPLFNDIYAQDRKDTDIYAHYLLNDISEVEVDDGSFLYRYSCNDIDWMIELNDTERDYLLSLEGFDMPNVLYRKYNSSSVSMIKKYDDLEYDIENFNTIIGKDGTKYGFWMIDIRLDNTSSSLSLISQYKIDDGRKVTYTYDNKLKWLKYVNNVNLEDNPEYMKRVLREIMPFMKTQPFEAFSKMTTVMNPSNLRLPIRFRQYKDGTNLNTNEVALSITEKYSKVQYQRYFGNIVPLIVPVSYVEDQWLLKFKDAKDPTSRIIVNGNYPSIGDCVIYDSSLQLGSRNSTPIWIPSTTPGIYDYENKTDNRVQLIEQKHFNNSVVVYCDPTLRWTNPQLISYNEIDTKRNEDNVYSVWKMLVSNTMIKNMNEDQKLFLYNRYESSTSVVPVKLNQAKTSKLYKITYSFMLK